MEENSGGETTLSDEIENSGTAAPSENATIAGALRGSIVNIVV